MTDSDAEWIDIDAIPNASPTKPGPNRPPPRPSTPSSVTERPRRYPWGGDGRPRRPMRPRRPFDEPERLPPTAVPSNDTVVISVSVASVLFLLAVISLLLYLFVLRKKLRKVQRSYSQSQFSLRVQDVAHLDVDDSSSLYVNTTDLQKLVSSIRVKNKEKPPPPLPLKNGDTTSQVHSSAKDLVKVSKSPAILPSDSTVSSYISEDKWKLKSDTPNIQINNSTTLQRAPSCDSVIYSNVSCRNGVYTTSLRRPTAPPPPAPSKSVDLSDHLMFKGSSDTPMITVRRDSQSQDTDNFYSVPLSKSKELAKHPDKEACKPRPPTNPKPKIQPILVKSDNSINFTKKPLLPPLKVNMRPPFSNQDSLSTTPDTARTCSTDVDTPTTSSPEVMSVKQKKALLEKVFMDEKKK